MGKEALAIVSHLKNKNQVIFHHEYELKQNYLLVSKML